MLLVPKYLPEEQQKELVRQIQVTLLRLRISPAIVGFYYHTEAIRQVVQSPQRIMYITKELYPDIAKLYGVSASSVERSMRTAVMHCWEQGGREALYELTGCHLTKRPSNSEFVALVAAYIRGLS